MRGVERLEEYARSLPLLGFVPASDLAVAFVNHRLTRSFGPTLRPALKLSDGITPELRILIAVPTLSFIRFWRGSADHFPHLATGHFFT